MAAVDCLTELLLPHLALEEERTMVEAGRLLTNVGWDELESKAFSTRQSVVRMALHGHWLIDGQTPDLRQRLLSTVPPAEAFTLLVAFAIPYALKRHAIWGNSSAAYIPALPVGTDPTPRRLRFSVDSHGERTHVTSATPEQVCAVVADPTRVGEWSHEAKGATWLDGATHAVPGARFVGTNRVKRLTWSKKCVVEVAEPGRRYSFHTPNTRWSYDLTPIEGGTLIRQSFELLNASRLTRFLIWLLVPAHRDRSVALGSDLVRLGEVASHEGQRSGHAEPTATLSSGPAPAA